MSAREDRGGPVGRTIRAVDLHAAGEHGRVIVGGVSDVPGDTMFDKMTWLQANADDLRLRTRAGPPLPLPLRPPLPLLAAALAALAVAGCGTTTTVGSARTLQIALNEYRVTPQDVHAQTGLLTIFVHNYGRLTHNLVISLDGRTEAASAVPEEPKPRAPRLDVARPAPVSLKQSPKPARIALLPLASTTVCGVRSCEMT